MRTAIAILNGLTYLIAIGCTHPGLLPEGERSLPPRSVRIENTDAAWATAVDQLSGRGYTLQVVDKASGLISSAWSPWECLSDSQKAWGQILVGRSGRCQKQATITLRGDRVTVRGAAQICIHNSTTNGYIGAETCRENDQRALADELEKEHDAILHAIELTAGRIETRPQQRRTDPDERPLGAKTSTSAARPHRKVFTGEASDAR